MVKFGSPDEEGLEKISWKILRIARAAARTVEKNGQEWDNRPFYMGLFSWHFPFPSLDLNLLL
jgi:hypothetical protein